MVVGAAVAVLVLLAASSGPVRLWITPRTNEGPSSIEVVTADTIALRDPPSAGVSDSSGSSIFFQIIGILLVVLVVAVAVSLARAWVRPRPRRLWRMRSRRPVAPLPELPEPELTVDVAAARAALSGGSPRNAIVACWMQLERDAAAAGLPRAPAETSVEYVERVVAASSVDPEPIGELAALYREARFSLHELRDDHRTRALAALSRVEAALQQRVEVTV